MASQEERDRIMAEYLASVQNDDDDDDDDDDEAEFQPGMDEEEEEDEDDYPQEDEEEDAIVWKGKLSFVDGKLHYAGKTSEGDYFDLSSPQPLYWNWKCPTATKERDEHRMRSLVFEGAPSNVDMTLTANKPQAAGSATGEEDGKMSAKMPPDDGKKKASSKAAAKVYTVYGQGSGFELYGELPPGDDDGVQLECRYQKVSAAPAAAASASAAAVSDDDDIDDVDEGVDYNELIALHEDAGMPVGELRKRVRRGADTDEASTKKPKCTPPDEEEDDDDDDDDDIGF